MSLRGFIAADVPDQTGRTVFITGANTGLGFEVTKVLAARGARVLMGCRSRNKAEAARDELLAKQPDADAAIVNLDLGDLASVRAAAKTVAQEPRLDVLINNAGLMAPPLGRTADGFEQQLGVNHLGPFLLTELLRSKLAEQDGSRIVVTSSNLHKQGVMDFRDPQAERGYGRWSRYCMSKLANLLHAQELQRQLEAEGSPTICTACHPGAARTELSRHLPGPMGLLMPLTSLFTNSPAEGAWPTLAAATSPKVGGGDYVGPDGIGEWSGRARTVHPSRRALDADVAARLWAYSQKAVALAA